MKYLKYVSLLFLIIFLMFQLNSCCVIGLGIGRAIDSSKPDFQKLPFPKISRLKPGVKLRILLDNGAIITGKYLYCSYSSWENYQAKYQAATDKLSDEIDLPALGERIKIYLEKQEIHEGKFQGFDFDRIYFRVNTSSHLSFILLESITEIKNEKGMAYTVENIQSLISERKIPLYLKIIIQVDKKEKLIPYNDVLFIEIYNERGSMLTGFLIGGIIDAVIVKLLSERPLFEVDL